MAMINDHNSWKKNAFNVQLMLFLNIPRVNWRFIAPTHYISVIKSSATSFAFKFASKAVKKIVCTCRHDDAMHLYRNSVSHIRHGHSKVLQLI